MSPNSDPPKRRKGCLLKITLTIVIIFGASLIHALTSGPSQNGYSAPMNPLLSMIACGAIIALLAWNPSINSSPKDLEISPLDKNENDNDNGQT